MAQALRSTRKPDDEASRTPHGVVASVPRGLPVSNGPRLDARAQQLALRRTLNGLSEPDTERYPGWTRALILLSAGTGAWGLTLGAGVALWRLATA